MSCSADPDPRTEADLPVARHGTAWQALAAGSQHAPVEVHVAVRCWVVGVEHDIDWHDLSNGQRIPGQRATWVELRTEHGEAFRIPAEHPVVLTGAPS